MGHDLPIDTRRPVDHQAALETSRGLCRVFARMYPEAVLMIDPADVFDALNQAGVEFVLFGAHGIGGWMQQARATNDVDVVVRKSHFKKGVKAISKAFPDLLVDEHAVVARFLDPSKMEPVIDVMRPIDLYQHAFDNAVQVAGGHRVPNVEMAAASKFADMVSRNRAEAKLYLDASDFIQIIQRNHERFDRQRLRELGDAVYPHGGDELLRMVDDVLAGRKLRV
ncbi:MAG TPA: hypothetical protein VNH11_17765 [Pirellulales bacterium]|nr:hypothetical protein [Pirellulales bacterium]